MLAILLTMVQTLAAVSPLAPPTSTRAPDPAPHEDLLVRARTRMAAEQRCVINPSVTDITVCGLRQADRFRVPLATHTADRRDMVAEGRAALVHARTPMEDMGPFLVGGGATGVRATVAFGPGEGSGSVAAGGMRTPAP
jgi:hypothetical protein